MFILFLCEIIRGQINLHISLISGSGNFGEVFVGLIQTPDKKSKKAVAIKCLKDESNQKEFFKEAIAVSELNHENIVEFLGIVKKSDTVDDMMIFEFMEGGQLLYYLESNQNYDDILQIEDMMKILLDICNGCAYMELMKFVHRDLAARNCLLTSIDPIKRMVNVLCTYLSQFKITFLGDF